MMLAAALARLGRSDETKAAEGVPEVQPNFRSSGGSIGGQCSKPRRPSSQRIRTGRKTKNEVGRAIWAFLEAAPRSVFAGKRERVGIVPEGCDKSQDVMPPPVRESSGTISRLIPPAIVHPAVIFHLHVRNTCAEPAGVQPLISLTF
jgi:hypothetical protein